MLNIILTWVGAVCSKVVADEQVMAHFADLGIYGRRDPICYSGYKGLAIPGIKGSCEAENHYA
jgi:hypothetical protein